MIERFMVMKNGKIIGYKPTFEGAKEIISRVFRKTKQDVYEIKDLEKDVYVCVTGFVASLKNAKQPYKRATRPKQGRNDVIDDVYTAWLGKQPCVVTGVTAKRGAGPHDMHCHHIHGRRGLIARNDYMQVPLLGSVHSWGVRAYHNLSKDEFLNAWKHALIGVENITEYFEDHARAFKEQYDFEMKGGENV